MAKEPERFDIGKLIRGFNIFKGEILGKILFVVAIVMICLGFFYVVFIRPTQKTVQKADTIQNITNITNDAVEATLFPPSVRGGVKLKLFGK